MAEQHRAVGADHSVFLATFTTNGLFLRAGSRPPVGHVKPTSTYLWWPILLALITGMGKFQVLVATAHFDIPVCGNVPSLAE